MHKRKNKRLILQTLTALLVGLLCAMLLGGCSRVEREEQSDVSRFKVIEETTTWRVVYDKYTKVMYAVSYSTYTCGSFTLLVDSEGEPLLWSGT